MKSKIKKGHAGRLEIGKKVLVAAESVNTTLVAERLAALAEQQVQYAAAVHALEDGQAREAEAAAAVEAGSALVDVALDKLIAALVVDGASYREPLAAYGTNPTTLKSAPQGEKAGLVTKLLAVVQRDEKRSPAVDRTVAAVAAVVAAYEERRKAFALVEEDVRGRRAARDVAGDRWEESLARLKRSAKVAEDDGAAGLYAALFSRSRRPATVRARSAPKSNESEAA